MIDTERLSEDHKEAKKDKNAPAFEEAIQEVKDLAKQVMGKYHPDLINVRVMYLFSLKARRSKGKIVLAWIQRPNKLLQYLSGEVDYFLFIDKKAWEIAKPEEREALLDHEFCHAVVDEDKEGNPVFKLRDHDFHEFTDIVERWGGWTQDLSAAIEAAYDVGERKKEIKRLTSVESSEEPKVEKSPKKKETKENTVAFE
jgi:hypothetical protein